MVTIYGISNCDTVKKARQWLADAHVDVRFHDFKRAGVPAALLLRWLEEWGWEVVLNRRGTAWRSLDEARKAQVVDEASALALMLENASLIKRPVVDWGNGESTLGFVPEVFETHRKSV